MIEKHTYVEVKSIILETDERSGNLPMDTKEVPLVMKIKGYLLEPAHIGDPVQILTMTKRIETGVLVKAHPSYTHSFGQFIQIIQDVKEIILSETEDLI